MIKIVLESLSGKVTFGVKPECSEGARLMEIQRRGIQTENSKGKDLKLRGASVHVRRTSKTRVNATW